jgi:hypothetical protein
MPICCSLLVSDGFTGEPEKFDGDRSILSAIVEAAGFTTAASTKITYLSSRLSRLKLD